jgi:2-hydroxyacyl-CoA lyase 1
MLHMFGMEGHFVKEIPQLQKAVKESIILTDRPSIINVIINPSADRKPQDFNWLTESKL